MRTPWAAFCISTFNRPGLLKKQLGLLLSQTLTDFEIVVSDNDPMASAKQVIMDFHDERLKYFQNGENLGMIRSFNKSVERSNAEFVVMVTDDDPIDPAFLKEIRELVLSAPGRSIYAGFTRRAMRKGGSEEIKAENFIPEILDPARTPWMLWSSALMNRKDFLEIGGIPDYGSPHLADHALIALVGSKNGGVIMNKQFSSLTSHDANFSKVNFNYYTIGCKGFYQTLTQHLANGRFNPQSQPIVKHLEYWFIGNIFNLKRYYAIRKPDKDMMRQINQCAEEILRMPFMKRISLKYRTKDLIFKAKLFFGFLK